MRFAWLLLAAGLASAQPASDLLQSAIFAQETTGDLDTAIRLYRQILSAGPGQRMYAPQAQFRLGECLLRKGDQRAAAEAFQAVIRNYPAEKTLAARARERMPGGEELLPKPWQDREVAEYRWSIPGSEDAWSIAFIAPSSATRSEDSIRQYYFEPAGHTLRVDVNHDSMRPTGASGPAFEASEVAYLLRREVLAPGLHAALPVNLPNGEAVTMHYAVEAVEEVTVPAGKFSCFRVRLAVPQPHPSIIEGTSTVPADGEILWYSTGAGRALVKMAAGAATGELTAVRVAEPSGQTVQRDPALGYSLVLPSNWITHTRISPTSRETTIDVIAVDSNLWMRIILMPGRREALDNAAANRIRTQAGRLPEYTVRQPPSIATLDGHPAVQWVAGFGAMTEFGICVRGESLLATITVQAPTSEFDSLRARFQPILDSFRLR